MLAIINVLSEVLGSLSSKFEKKEEREKKELLKKALEQLGKRKREKKRPILLQEEQVLLCLQLLEGRGVPQETIFSLVNSNAEIDAAAIAQKILLLIEEQEKKIKDKLELEKEQAQVAANTKAEEHRMKVLNRMWEERKRLQIDEINASVTKTFVIHATASLDFDSQSLASREDKTNLKIKISDLEVNVEFLRENLRLFTESKTPAIAKLREELKIKEKDREAIVLEYQNASREVGSTPSNDKDKELDEKYQTTEKDIIDISSKISSLSEEIQNESSRIEKDIQQLEFEIKNAEAEMLELAAKSTETLERFSTSQLSLEETEREQDLVRHKEIALAKEIGKDDPVAKKMLILRSEIDHATIEMVKLNDEISINNTGLDNRNTAIQEKELRLRDLYQELETLKQDSEADKYEIKRKEKEIKIRQSELSELKSESDRLLKDQVTLKENLDSKMSEITRKKEIKDALESRGLVASLEVERAHLQQDSEKIAQQIAENTRKRQDVIGLEKKIVSDLSPKPQPGEPPSYEYHTQQEQLKTLREEKRILLMKGYALEELQLKNVDSIKNIDQAIKGTPAPTDLTSTKKTDDKPTVAIPNADNKKKDLKKDAPPTLVIAGSTPPSKKSIDNAEDDKDDHSQKMSAGDQKPKKVFQDDVDLKITEEDGWKRFLQGLFKLTILLQRAVAPIVRNIGGALQASGGIVAMGLTAVPATVAKGITVVGEKLGADPNGKLIRGSNAVVNAFKSSASFSKEGLMKAGNLKRFGKDSFGLAIGRWVEVPPEKKEDTTPTSEEDQKQKDPTPDPKKDTKSSKPNETASLAPSTAKSDPPPVSSLPVRNPDGSITTVPPSPRQKNGEFYPVDADMSLMTRLTSSQSDLGRYKQNPYADDAASKKRKSTPMFDEESKVNQDEFKALVKKSKKPSEDPKLDPENDNDNHPKKPRMQ